MRPIPKTLLLLLFSLSFSWIECQNVGIGVSAPLEKLHVAGNLRMDNALVVWPGAFAAAAAPDVNVPYSTVRLTATAGAQANAVTYSATAIEGQWLLLSNEDNDAATFAGASIPSAQARLFVYTNGSWRPAFSSAGASGWLTTGNAGTSIGTNFLGTTDDVALQMRTNNQQAGLISNSAGSNTFMGYQAGAVATGNSNSFFGHQAGRLTNTGGSNVCVGHRAGENNTTGSGNINIGYLSGNGNSTGIWNVCIGRQAGQNNSASGNIFIGDLAGQGNSSGVYNVCIGQWSGNGLNGATASANTFVGYMSGFANSTAGGNTFVGNNAGTNTNTGIQNTYLGCQAGQGYTAGANNVSVGWRAGFYTAGSATGSNNVFVGLQAGDNNFTGNGNVIIGYDADVTATGLTNAIAIGNTATVNASNKIRMGNAAITAADVQVNWTITSDRNEKAELRTDVPGLNLITRLQPVTYYYRSHLAAHGQDAIRYTGLIAQDVDSVLQSLGIQSSIVAHPAADGSGSWGIRYGELVMPLIEAVQEQQQMILQLQKEKDEMESRLSRIEAQLDLRSSK